MPYTPKIGDTLTVTLPHEMIRATVSAVSSRNLITADLNLAHPFTRLHGYGFGQSLKFRRQKDMFGEKWLLVDGQPKATPALSVPSYVGDDEHVAVPERQIEPQKGKRRSDMEAERKRDG